MFFSNWYSVVRVAVIGASAYVLLVAALRISGKRTLSRLNIFDMVVTVAFGSTLATVILSKDVAFAEGGLALVLLILLQLIVAWLSLHISFFNRLIKSEPRLLYHEGAFLERAMRDERVKKEEILQAIRKGGFGSLRQIESVVLETNSQMSVIAKYDMNDSSALKNVKGID